jgi:hypothetical protein
MILFTGKSEGQSISNVLFVGNPRNEMNRVTANPAPGNLAGIAIIRHQHP